MQAAPSISSAFPFPAASAGARPWLPLPVWLLAGYLFLITAIGKGPTYLGIPPLFLGEMVMAASFVWIVDRYGAAKALLADRGALTAAVWMFMLLGAAITMRGVGDWGMDALRDAALWYYGVFFFVGFCLARDEVFAPRLWRIFCITWGVALVWGTADQASQMFAGFALSSLGPVLPWRGEKLLFNSTNELVQHMVLASMIVFHSRLHLGWLGRWRAPLAIVACAALGIIAVSRGRGVKVGIVLSTVLLAALVFAPGRRTLQLSRSVALVLLIALLAGVAGVLVMQDDFLRVTQLDRFLDANPSSPSGTAFWRWIWWKVLWREVLDTDPLFGLGFGQSLSIYNPYLEGDADTAWPVRSPHNFNITVFTRMGFVGLAVWLSILLLGVGGLLRRVWRGRGPSGWYSAVQREQLAFWLVALIATWGNGTFGVLMEGPVLGIWFWFALGWARGVSCRPNEFAREECG